MAAQHAPPSQPRAIPYTVFLQGLDGILRAARMEATVVSEKRTDRKPIAAHAKDQQTCHCANPRNSELISSRSNLRSTIGMRVRTRTTMSRRTSCGRIRRNDSRTMRLMRFRETADRTCFFATTMPNRAEPPAAGRWSNSKLRLRTDLRKAKTDENSSVLRSLNSLRKPRSTTAASPISNAEATAALGSSGADDCSPAARAHADEEAVGTFAANNGRLVSTFHGASRIILDKRAITSSDRHLVKFIFFDGLWITLRIWR